MTCQGQARDPEVSRRTMLGVTAGGVALPWLAACGEDSGASADADTNTAGSGTSQAADGQPTVAEADVPVGSGTILSTEKVVVTQPTKGQFKAFTAICTHQGCLVSSIEDAEIVCACHNSHFSIEDGAVVSGPAQSPLDAKQVTTEDGQITVS